MDVTRLSLSQVMAILLIASFCSSFVKAGQYDDWPHAMNIIMDTTSSGADVSSTVENYPLAVRLSSENFDFSQARAGGEDVRFAAADGTVLPYEIEKWDSVKKEAIVWVKTTVLGHNGTQKIMMYWGKADAESESRPQDVFHTDHDWIGVYHLSEPSNTDQGNFKDATPNEAHATGKNMKSEDAEDGNLGGSIRFVTARGNSIQVSGAKRDLFLIPSGDWSLSMWATKDGISNAPYQTLMCMGDDHWTMQRWGTRHVFESCVKINVSPAFLCTMKGKEFTDEDDSWFHLTVNFERNVSTTVYLNGEFYDRADYAPGKWSLTSSFPFAIGSQTQHEGRTWSGRIDEARVTNRILSADWARLEYASQKPGSNFLSFEKVR